MNGEFDAKEVKKVDATEQEGVREGQESTLDAFSLLKGTDSTAAPNDTAGLMQKYEKNVEDTKAYVHSPEIQNIAARIASLNNAIEAAKKGPNASAELKDTGLQAFMDPEFQDKLAEFMDNLKKASQIG